MADTLSEIQKIHKQKNQIKYEIIALDSDKLDFNSYSLFDADFYTAHTIVYESNFL